MAELEDDSGTEEAKPSMSPAVADTNHTFSSPSRPRPSRRPFRYNPLHDLEALWWMSVYFAAGRAVVDDGTGRMLSEEENARQIQKQLESFPRLFCKLGIRLDIMSRAGRFAEEMQSLYPSVLCFWRPLESARSSLAYAYRWVEQDMDAREFAPPIAAYDGLRQGWFAIAKHLRKRDVIVKPLPVV